MSSSPPPVVVPHIVAVNAALGGEGGKTAALVERAVRQLGPRARVTTLSLAEQPGFDPHVAVLASADAFLFATGTYWDSWSSHLQRFLEEGTPFEGTPLWLGKPVGVLVTAHSVGGKGVLSRLQGVLSTLGCAIPPMSGIVVKLASQTALAAGGDGHALDFWSPDDLEVVAHNLLEAAAGTRRFVSWDVDRQDPKRRWLQAG